MKKIIRFLFISLLFIVLLLLQAIVIHKGDYCDTIPLSWAQSFELAGIVLAIFIVIIIPVIWFINWLLD